MNTLPPYESVLTGGAQALVPLLPEHMRYFAALGIDDPPTSAILAYTTLQYPVRLKSQLRENLKREGITIVDHHEVSPEELEQIYRAAEHKGPTRPTDQDYERNRETVMAILAAAVQSGASDIHIVRRRRTASVTFRINGQINPRSEWSDTEADNTCRFIYEIMAQDQSVTWNPREPQDAVIDTSLNTGTRVRVRVGTIPASPDGYDMVLRVLPTIGDSLPLQQLGYTQPQLVEIRKLVRRPSGLVVMAGGVGSGKSTSLIGMLHAELEVHEQALRIITVEDPPERVIPHATQVPVVRNASRHAPGDEFLTAIIGALRCDPDTLMVGEIRDRPAAELTIKFAQSGHRVYTTVHAASALGVVARLVSMGIDATLLCTPDVLKGLIFQTLVPVLCEHCKVSIFDAAALATASQPQRECVERLSSILAVRGRSDSNVAIRGPGCDKCGRSAIAGRTLIPEIVVPDDEILRFLAQGDTVAAQRHWLQGGGQPAADHGLELIVAGVSSPLDVEWRIGQLDLAASQAGHINGSDHPSLAGHA